MGKYPINNEVEKHIGLEASGEVIDANTGYLPFDIEINYLMESLCFPVALMHNMLLYQKPMLCIYQINLLMHR
jgi:hypothetical protein